MLCVPHINILGPITDALQSHLGVSPSGIPRGAPGRKSTLSKQYFKRIEAVEFTIRQDDGALPKNIIQADIVLTGVSRTSKTPLSTYMAQKGYKVLSLGSSALCEGAYCSSLLHNGRALNTRKTSAIFSSLFVHVLPLTLDGSKFQRDFF